ncbi:MAG TPA: BamA/TamA family outer membrane protein [bacterium]|nr:BamA/TamA family outer membrane protein [bacterium]
MKIVLRRRRWTCACTWLVVILALALGTAQPPLFAQTPTPTPTSSPTPAPTPLPAPTATPVPAPAAPTASPAPGATPTTAPSPTPTARPTPTATPAAPRPAATATPAQRVIAVEVVGNKQIALERITEVITTKVGEVLDPEKVRRDLEAILQLGWFADVSIRVETEPTGVRVVFLIVENPVISTVAVEGNTVIATEALIGALKVPLGQVLNARQLREGIRAVEQLYESRGYVLARVTDATVEPAGDGRLVIRIAEGRVEDIVFRGLTKTRPRVAQRYLRMKRGDVFNVGAMNADLQRLFDSGLFENVQARPRPGSGPDTVVIEIEVKEAQTGRIGFGIGYSSARGLIGQIEYGERNWRGTGQSISLRIERGITRGTLGISSKLNFQLNYREPFLDDRPTTLEIGLFGLSSIQSEVISRETTSRFELERTGSFLEVGRPLDAVTTLSLRVRSELAVITALPLDSNSEDCPCPLPSLYSPGRTISLLTSAVRETRDSRINPTRGSRQLLSLEVGLPVLGGEFSFQKYFGEYIQYFSVGAGHVAARAQLGLGSGFIPFQEWYVLGGPTTLRGAQAGQFRGTSMAMVNVEYRHPLGGIASFLKEFQGIVFVDVGAAPISGGGNFSTSYGIGTSFNSPLGVIRFDLAFGPGGTQTWINLGQPF